MPIVAFRGLACKTSRLEAVLKPLKDSEQAGELPKVQVELREIFPASRETSIVLEPGEGAFDLPTVFVMSLIIQRHSSRLLVSAPDEWADQAEASFLEAEAQRVSRSARFHFIEDSNLSNDWGPPHPSPVILRYCRSSKKSYEKHQEFMLAPAIRRGDGQLYMEPTLGIIKNVISFANCRKSLLQMMSTRRP